MKILLIHNRYSQRGGEDAVAEAEARLLESRGHTVIWYERNNDELCAISPFRSMLAGIDTLWASRSFREIKALISRARPEVAHFHNTFPLISPAAYYACAEAHIPAVQTLHNYRLLCPSAAFLRDGKVCEECIGRAVAWPSVAHGCYRGDRAATLVLAAMQVAHRAMGTWRDKVQIYIALSEFARRKFIEGGLPAERIVVKHNFVSVDPGLKQGCGDYALFVGRLSEEKGLRVLLDAWAALRAEIPLRIAGDGPLRDWVAGELKLRRIQGVKLLGRVAAQEIVSLMRGARFLVLPSISFENFPMVVAEAFACGLPVIASRLGAMAEIVADGATGLHFAAGDSQDLAAKAEWSWSQAEEMQTMGWRARAEYEEKYTAERNYEQMVAVWDRLGIHASV